ncbi:MAG: alpha-1,2-fucosyltransferase [Bacteroidia bacterium]|jgi:hypothetical protein
MAKQLTVYLLGGLGNQMFQYAAARALSKKNAAELYLDNKTGFVRDKIYKRNYELGSFPINGKIANLNKRLPFWTERFWRKFSNNKSDVAINKRICISSIKETHLSYLPEVANYQMNGCAWMYGHWQSEEYFKDIADIIKKELTPPVPKERHYKKWGDLISSCNSVAVGVRLFEEMPGSKNGVGGVTPISFFNNAANTFFKSIDNPVFFVFCTTNSPQLKELNFPGPVHFITNENGFTGSVETLWLITKCKHHIIANSSFYWWGAWLSEKENNFSKIIASSLFPNNNSIPQRWISN